MSSKTTKNLLMILMFLNENKSQQPMNLQLHLVCLRLGLSAFGSAAALHTNALTEMATMPIQLSSNVF
jgi:hypothetical protein